MKIDYKVIDDFSKQYGDCFYILDLNTFADNYHNLLVAFRKHWINTDIAYSFKTNYIPNACSHIAKLGGYAEVVSDMELYLARKVGFEGNHIYFNGPYKQPEVIEDFLISGGHLNVDSIEEVLQVVDIAQKYKDKKFSLGIRFALDIGQELPSRFGFDIEGLSKAIDILEKIDNVTISGIHTHLPYRGLDTFKQRATALKELLYNIRDLKLEYLSIGGGYMGPMPSSLIVEMKSNIEGNKITMPSYDDYADAIAAPLAETFKTLNCDDIKLVLEPGSAIVANAMSLFCKVVSIKKNYNKNFITVVGSTFNMNPTVRGLNRPITVHRMERIMDSKDADSLRVEEADIVGFTCIEGDCLYKDFTGEIHIGDYVEFHNVGSYSVTMNPAFIRPMPSIAIVENEKLRLIKKSQTFEEIFNKYEN